MLISCWYSKWIIVLNIIWYWWHIGPLRINQQQSRWRHVITYNYISRLDRSLIENSNLKGNNLSLQKCCLSSLNNFDQSKVVFIDNQTGNVVVIFIVTCIVDLIVYKDIVGIVSVSCRVHIRTIVSIYLSIVICCTNECPIDLEGNSYCSWCSWGQRSSIYSCCITTTHTPSCIVQC